MRFDDDFFDDETESLEELRGHRRISCRACGYRGWSEDTGGCPRCPVDELAQEDHDDAEI